MLTATPQEAITAKTPRTPIKLYPAATVTPATRSARRWYAECKARVKKMLATAGNGENF